MPVTIPDAFVKRDSGKAILVDAPELDEATWIPKSQVDDDSEVYDGTHDGKGPCDLVISDWIAEEKGLSR